MYYCWFARTMLVGTNRSQVLYPSNKKDTMDTHSEGVIRYLGMLLPESFPQVFTQTGATSRGDLNLSVSDLHALGPGIYHPYENVQSAHSGVGLRNRYSLNFYHVASHLCNELMISHLTFEMPNCRLSK